MIPHCSFDLHFSSNECFPGDSDGQDSAYCIAQETQVQSLGWKDSPGEENGNPLQYSCLENPMDREAKQATVHVVAKSRTQLSN